MIISLRIQSASPKCQTCLWIQKMDIWIRFWSRSGFREFQGSGSEIVWDHRYVPICCFDERSTHTDPRSTSRFWRGIHWDPRSHTYRLLRIHYWKALIICSRDYYISSSTHLPLHLRVPISGRPYRIIHQVMLSLMRSFGILDPAHIFVVKSDGSQIHLSFLPWDPAGS